jgi:hypothetical protein
MIANPAKNNGKIQTLLIFFMTGILVMQKWEEDGRPAIAQEGHFHQM